MKISVFMMNLKSARAMFLPVSIAAIVTSLFDFLFIVITQQRHFVIPPFRFGYCSLCYNIVKSYTSPPMVIMTAGGFEPPRQLPASSCQDYCVCQLHHAVRSENLVEGDSLPAQPSTKSHLKNIPDDGCLSRVICGRIKTVGHVLHDRHV